MEKHIFQPPGVCESGPLQIKIFHISAKQMEMSEWTQKICPLRGVRLQCSRRIKELFRLLFTDERASSVENAYMQVVYNAGRSFIIKH